MSGAAAPRELGLLPLRAAALRVLCHWPISQCSSQFLPGANHPFRAPYRHRYKYSLSRGSTRRRQREAVRQLGQLDAEELRRLLGGVNLPAWVRPGAGDWPAPAVRGGAWPAPACATSAREPGLPAIPRPAPAAGDVSRLPARAVADHRGAPDLPLLCKVHGRLGRGGGAAHARRQQASVDAQHQAAPLQVQSGTSWAGQAEARPSGPVRLLLLPPLSCSIMCCCV